MYLVPENAYENILDDKMHIPSKALENRQHSQQEDFLVDYNLKKETIRERRRYYHKRVDSRDWSGCDDDSFFNRSLSTSTVGTTPTSPTQYHCVDKTTQMNASKRIDLDEVTKQYCNYEKQLSMNFPMKDGSEMNKFTETLDASCDRIPRDSFSVEFKTLTALSVFEEHKLAERVNLKEMLEESRDIVKTNDFDIYDECLSQGETEACRSLPDDFKFNETLPEQPIRSRLLSGLKRFSFFR